MGRVGRAAHDPLFSDGARPGEGAWLRDGTWQHPPTPGSIATQATLLALGNGFTLNNALWSLVHEWRFSMVLPLLLAAPVLGARGTASLVLAAVAASSWAVGPYGSMTYIGATAVGTVKASL